MSPEALEQRRAALVHANNIRIERAEWKRSIANQSMADGARHFAYTLEEPLSQAVGACQTFDALHAIHAIGPAKILKCLSRCGIYSGSRPLRDLTERQRGALITYVLEQWT